MGMIPQKGDFIEIAVDTCQDIDLVEWVLDQPKNRFEIETVDYETEQVWIYGCDMGIFWEDIYFADDEDENDL